MSFFSAFTSSSSQSDSSSSAAPSTSSSTTTTTTTTTPPTTHPYRPTICYHECEWGSWGEADWRPVCVRGPTYLTDRVKIPMITPPLFKLVHFEIFQSPSQIFHTSSRSHSFTRQRKMNSSSSSSSSLRPDDDDFMFVVSFIVDWNPSYHVICYFQRYEKSERSRIHQEEKERRKKIKEWEAERKKEAEANGENHSVLSMLNPNNLLSSFGWGGSNTNTHANATTHENHDSSAAAAAPPSDSTISHSVDHENEETRKINDNFDEDQMAASTDQSFSNLFRRYVLGDNNFRNSRLKMIPVVAEGGNWLVTKTVGNRPAIIGNKIATHYFQDNQYNYLECCIDVSSSSIGSGIFRVVKGYSSCLAIDLTFVLEGQQEDELPEAILGGCRLFKPDLDKVKQTEQTTNQTK